MGSDRLEGRGNGRRLIMADGITLSDLLEDAATCLEETGKPALGKASRMAAAIVSDEPHGESWIADVLQVLTEAEDVVITARDAQGKDDAPPVDLGGLAEALDVCAGWGLTPDQRMLSAYTRILHDLSTLRALLEAGQAKSETDRIHEARGVIERLLDALGFGERVEDKHE